MNLYGATHFYPRVDGITPQMYYKKMPIGYADEKCIDVWHYLSYANIWMGSDIKNGSFEESKLIPISKLMEGTK